MFGFGLFGSVVVGLVSVVFWRFLAGFGGFWGFFGLSSNSSGQREGWASSESASVSLVV